MTDAMRIVNDVAENYGITVEDLLSPKRKRPLPDARAIIFWLLCYTLHMSTTEAGETLNRDHSTVVAGMKKVDTWITVPHYYQRELNLLNEINIRYEEKGVQGAPLDAE